MTGEQMKIRNKKVSTVLILLCMLISYLFSGCVSREEIYEEVARSRQRAYKDWTIRRKAEKKSKAHIEGKLTLQDAIKLAIQYNKKLQSVAEERQIAKGRIVESYSEFLPSLNANANYTRLDRVGGFDVGGEEVSLGFLDNYSVDLKVEQPIYRGGGIGAAIRAARVFSLLTDETVKLQYQQTLFDVASAYFETLLAKQLYLANKDAVESAQGQLEQVQARKKQGLAYQFDVLRAQVDVSNFRAEMIQQKNRINLARTRLFKAMGVSQESEVTLADKLSYEQHRIPFSEAVKVAFENRPDLYSSEYSMRLQQEALIIEKSGYWPDVDGFFTQNWSKPDPHLSTLNEWGDLWQAGLTIQWPLFTGLSREGKIMQEEAKLKQRQYELLDNEERALLEVQQALLSMEDAEELVQSQSLNLERAREGLRLAEEGYIEGINTQVEVTDARAALTRARSLYYQAIYSHTIARLNLQNAMGVLGLESRVLGQEANSQKQSEELGNYSAVEKMAEAESELQ